MVATYTVESSGDHAPPRAQNVWGLQAMLNVGDVQPVTLAFEPPTFSMNIWCRGTPPAELTSPSTRSSVPPWLSCWLKTWLPAMDRFRNPSLRPVPGLRLTMRGMPAPLMDVKAPPTSRCPRTGARISTVPLAACAKPVTTLPVLVLISAMLVTLVPLTLVKFPPM